MTTIFSSGATIDAFFAGFALNIVVSAGASENGEVRRYAAICALFFVLLVLTCGAGGVVFAYYKAEFLPIMAELHKTPDEIEAEEAEKERGEQIAEGREKIEERNEGEEEREKVEEPTEGKEISQFQKPKKWHRRHLWAVFGLIPSFLFTILAAGVYFFFLIMREYEPDVAFAGLATIGVGTMCGGIGWLCLLHSYTPGIRSLFWGSSAGEDVEKNAGDAIQAG